MIDKIYPNNQMSNFTLVQVDLMRKIMKSKQGDTLSKTKMSQNQANNTLIMPY